jgi:hypothetical protein
LAAKFYAGLKDEGRSIELVQEYVQQLVYAGQTIKGWDYVHSFAQQFEAERRVLEAGVRMIITDSPLLLQCFYAYHCACPVVDELMAICHTFEAEFPSLNFFIPRSDKPFNPEGRYQKSLTEARAMDDMISDMMYLQGVTCSTIHAHKDMSVDYFLERLKVKTA